MTIRMHCTANRLLIAQYFHTPKAQPIKKKLASMVASLDSTQYCFNISFMIFFPFNSLSKFIFVINFVKLLGPLKPIWRQYKSINNKFIFNSIERAMS